MSGVPKRDPMTNEEVAIPICRVAPVVILAAQQVGAKFYVAMAYRRLGVGRLRSTGLLRW